jgi:hypothetical protein
MFFLFVEKILIQKFGLRQGKWEFARRAVLVDGIYIVWEPPAFAHFVDCEAFPLPWRGNASHFGKQKRRFAIHIVFVGANFVRPHCGLRSPISPTPTNNINKMLFISCY